MSSSTAEQLRGDGAASTTTTSKTSAAVSSSQPAPSLRSPSYTFSAEAAPFFPSFMRAAPMPSAAASGASVAENRGLTSASPSSLQQPAGAPASGNPVEMKEDDRDEEMWHTTEDNEDNYRQRFSKMWMLCLEQMQGHEVGMLMDMLPLDIQDLYFDKLSDEYLHHDHEHKDKGVHALCAAQKMVKELSPEQLAYIEKFLVETDALNPKVERRRHSAHLPHRMMNIDGKVDDEDVGDDDENLFMNEDEGIGAEEEEWLLEQMMVASGHADEVAAMKNRK